MRIMTKSKIGASLLAELAAGLNVAVGFNPLGKWRVLPVALATVEFRRR
jgi:hypothetical protein